MTLDAVGPESTPSGSWSASSPRTSEAAPASFGFRPSWALWLCRQLGRAVHDVVLTREEVKGLMAGLLVSQGEPTGRTGFSEWLSRHAHLLGIHYASELSRHFRREDESNGAHP